MWINTSNAVDPVLVRQSYSPGKVELRIGKERPGETRYTRLSPREAWRVAYALLAAAEEALDRKSNWDTPARPKENDEIDRIGWRNRAPRDGPGIWFPARFAYLRGGGGNPWRASYCSSLSAHLGCDGLRRVRVDRVEPNRLWHSDRTCRGNLGTCPDVGYPQRLRRRGYALEQQGRR